MCTCKNCDKNVDRSSVGENFNFLDFLKSFRNWRKLSYVHFNRTKIQKLTHLEDKCARVWIEPKMLTHQAVGENFNFFDFLKSFWNWRKSSYFHFNTTKIQKFTYLEEKCAHVWTEPKMLTGPRWAKTSIFWFCFKKSFQYWRKSSYFHFNKPKQQKFTLLRKTVHMCEWSQKCRKISVGQ